MNKVKQIQNLIENAFTKREELLESIRSVEALSLDRRNELGSVMEIRLKKAIELERFAKFCCWP